MLMRFSVKVCELFSRMLMFVLRGFHPISTLELGLVNVILYHLVS